MKRRAPQVSLDQQDALAQVRGGPGQGQREEAFAFTGQARTHRYDGGAPGGAQQMRRQDGVDRLGIG